jgi:hypothetical protein
VLSYKPPESPKKSSVYITNVLFRPILVLLGLVMSMQVLQFICFLAIEGFKVVNHFITGTGAQAFSFGVSQYFAIV